MGRRNKRGSAPGVLRPDTRWNRLAPWPVTAALAGAASAAIGWCLCAAGCLLTWLAATETPVREPLRLATQLWLAGHFVPARLAGGVVSITPLGLTLVIAAIGSGLAGAAVQHAFDAPPPASERGHWQPRVAGVFAAAYLAMAVIGATLADVSAWTARGVVGCVVLTVAMAWWGAGRALGWRLDLEVLRLPWPRWLDAAPRALAAGGGTIVAGGALVAVIAMAQHHDRMTGLGDALGAGVLGGLVLLALQAAWVPNVVLWGVSWVCGAGFSLGTETTVAPLATRVGLLPSLPLFGAVPAEGVASKAMALWLVLPLLAGAACAWVLVGALLDDGVRRGTEPVSPVVSGVVGALSGGVLGLLATLVVALAGGDLGTLRLVGLGAYLPGLFALAPTLMGLGGLGAGLAVGWQRGPRDPASEPLRRRLLTAMTTYESVAPPSEAEPEPPAVDEPEPPGADESGPAIPLPAPADASQPMLPEPTVVDLVPEIAPAPSAEPTVVDLVPDPVPAGEPEADATMAEGSGPDASGSLGARDDQTHAASPDKGTA